MQPKADNDTEQDTEDTGKNVMNTQISRHIFILSTRLYNKHPDIL